MKTGRWPYHPPPYPNEALSSWLFRTASILDNTPLDLIKYEFGIVLTEEDFLRLDYNVSNELLKKFAECTGFDYEFLVSLTIKSYVPLLIDHLDASDTSLFHCYTGQFSLFKRRNIAYTMDVHNWLPWSNLKEVTTYMGCQHCLQHDVVPFIRLHWRLLWVITCPYHKTLLKPVTLYRVLSGKVGFFFMHKNTMENCEVIDTLFQLDAYTIKAVTEGHITLYNRHIHAGIWLRILRTVIEEMTLPLYCFIPKHQKSIRDAWHKLNLNTGCRVARNLSYENQKDDGKINVMQVTSLIINSILSGDFDLKSSVGRLLSPIKSTPYDLPSMHACVTEELKGTEVKKDKVSLGKAIDEFIQLMKIDSEAVKFFRTFMQSIDGRKESSEKLDQYLRNLGIKF